MKKLLILSSIFSLFVSAHAASKYWVSSGSSIWNSSANWSATSGGSGGAGVPGSSDVAYFDGGGSNNGNCTIDATVDVAGLIISGYSGTISQGTYNLVVGSSNFSQSSGTFTGGSGYLNFICNFSLSGGTFTSTSGVLYLTGNWTHTSGGTFNNNSGTMYFHGSSSVVFDVNITETYFNVTLLKTSSSYPVNISADDVLKVTGNLVWTTGYFWPLSSGSILEVQGNVTMATGIPSGVNQPLRFSGSVNQNFDLTGATYFFDGPVTIDKLSGQVVLLSNFTMDYSGQTLTLTSGTLNLNGNTLTNTVANTICNGTFTVAGTGTMANYGWTNNGLANISFSVSPNVNIGAGNFTQTAGTFSSGSIPLAINGDFILSGGIFNATTGIQYISGSWTHASGGTFNHNNGTLIFNGATNGTYDVSSNETFYNVSMVKSSLNNYLTISTNDILTIEGNLIFTTGYFFPTSGSLLDAKGNVTIGTGIPSGVNQPLRFSGSANQNFDLSGATYYWDGDIIVNKTGGEANLLSAATFDGVNQSFTITQGTFDLSGYTLSAPGSGGSFTVQSGGNLQMQGGETCSTPTLNNGSTISYNGTGGAYNLKNYSYKNLTLNGGASTVFSLPTNITGMETVTISQGILSLAGYNLTATTLSNNGTFRLRGFETITLTTTDLNSGIFEYVGRDVAENLTIKDFGSTDYYSLKINDANTNKATYILGADLDLAGVLTLTSSNISLGSYNLTLVAGSSLSGGSSSSFIYTGSTGFIKYLSCAASSTKTFPVGHTNSSAGYVPLVITFNTGSTTDDYSVIAVDKVTNDGTRNGTAYTSTVVKAMWFITETVSGGSNVNMQFQWNGTDEATSFVRSSCYMSHYTNSAWDNPGSNGSASGSNPYTFTYSNYTGTFSPFGMGGSGGPLPVKLLYFKAKNQNGTSHITWATASEINNDYFNIEKSKDGKNFEIIGKINGAGNSQQILKYEFIDSNLASGINYYRLKQTDYNGEFSYSDIEIINNYKENENKIKLSLYPVPATDLINIELNSVADLKTRVKVLNILGNPVLEKNITLQRGNNHVEMDINNLPEGVYFIQIPELENYQSTRFLKK